MITPVAPVPTPDASIATSGKQSPIAKEIAALPMVARNDKNAYFEFSPVPNNIAGYIWDFPTQVKGEPMRCWGIYDTNILADGKRPQLKASLAEEMKRFGYDLNELRDQGTSHPLVQPGE